MSDWGFTMWHPANGTEILVRVGPCELDGPTGYGFLRWVDGETYLVHGCLSRKTYEMLASFGFSGCP